MGGKWINIIIFSVIGITIFGYYNVFTNNHYYTNRFITISLSFFPYATYIGIKEIYDIIFSKNRKIRYDCLERLEARGAPRKLRFEFCECIEENGDEKAGKIVCAYIMYNKYYSK